MSAPFASPWRPLVAGLSGVLGSALLLTELDGTLAVLIPVVCLIVAGAAAHATHLGAQLFARAAWWSNLLLGVFITVVGSRSEVKEGVLLALGSGVALLVADRRSLVEATAKGRYVPAAFRGTLQVVMILALADMQTLLLLGSLSIDQVRGGVGVAFFAAALALALGFVGLYRLEIWGVLVTMGTALALALALLSGALDPDRDFLPALLVLCAMQLLAPAPMLVSLASKKPLPQVPARALALAGASLVGLIMGVAVIATAVR